MIQKLTLWKCELDDELKPYEIFKGIKSVIDNKGDTYFVGLVELWETASRASGERYVNIKFTKKD